MPRGFARLAPLTFLPALFTGARGPTPPFDSREDPLAHGALTPAEGHGLPALAYARVADTKAASLAATWRRADAAEPYQGPGAAA